MATPRTVVTSRSGKPISRPPIAEAPIPQARIAEAVETVDETREPAREPVRKAETINGRVVVTNRAGQPVSRASAASGVDQFAIPPALLAKIQSEGWSWEWKSESIVGLSRQDHMAEMYQVGWEPVLYEHHPGVFAPRFNDDGSLRKGPVRRKEMVLMERRIELTLEAQRDEKRKADGRVQTAQQQYRAGPDTSGTQTAVYDDSARRMATTRQYVEPVIMPGQQRQPVD